MLKILSSIKNRPNHIIRNIQTKSVQHLLTLDTVPPDTEIRVIGWIKSFRDHKQLKFIHLYDGTSNRSLQLVINLDNKLATNKLNEELFKKLNLNTSIEAFGKLVRSSHVEKQPFELQVSNINVIGECNANEYPFKARTKLTLEAIRNHVHLRTHTNEFANILKFRSQLTYSFHDFFQKANFCQVHTPVLTTNNCEGGCETFRVETNQKRSDEGGFFGSQAFLTASAQLHLETMTTTLAKVYTLSPTFRAEKSMTRHHLAEFYMLEAELIDMNNLESLLEFTETLVRDVALNTYNKFSSEFLSSFSRPNYPKNSMYTEMIKLLIEKPFVRITYSEAVELIKKLLNSKLNKKMTKKSIEFGEDFNKEQEKLLVSHFENVPVFVTHYPTALKPFYMRQNVDRPEFVDNFDLLAPFVGEIVGGSLREYRLEILKEAMKKQGLDTEVYAGYLETKKFGGMKMGGFGLGLERFMQFLLNIENIRDTSAFPRALNHCKM